MRADCLFLVCLAALAVAADDATPEAARSPSSAAATAVEEPKEAEMLDVAESSNNNTASAVDDATSAAGGERSSNAKRTIDHSLGYGYRYNTVLRPVHHHPMMHGHHYVQPGRRPVMYKLQPRYPHHYFPGSAAATASGTASGPASASTGSGGGVGGAPFRYSQPLPAPPPPQREESAETTMSPRPVTEAPSGPHGESLGLYRTLPQHVHHQHVQHGHHEPPVAFQYEDDLPKGKAEAEPQGAADAQPVQYADDAPHSYQQVVQAEPTYFLTSAASPASSMLSPFAMYGHAAGGHALGHPAIMYASTGGAGSHAAAATQMIPVIIVRLVDSQAAAATLSPGAALGHTMTPMGHAMGHASMAHAMPHVPYPLVNMQFLRDYLSKLYAPAATSAQPQYVTAADPDAALLYSSPLFTSAQLQKLQLQQQLHAQIQKQLQMQQQQAQHHRDQQQQQQHHQQQRSSASSVAAILQEQHRQRVAAAQGRTEVTVHRSPAMSPQDYKESVEQQEEP